MTEQLGAGGEPAASFGAPEGGATPEAVLESLSTQLNDAAMFPESLREQFLFVYDILLSQDTIGRFIKGLLPWKVVHLPHFQLVFPYYYPPAGTSLPSLVRTNNASDCVWGVIYATRGKDLSALERYMRVPQRYHRVHILTQDRGGRRFPAFAYSLSLTDEQATPPAEDYRDSVVAAGAERGLPEEWLSQLRELPVTAGAQAAGEL